MDWNWIVHYLVTALISFNWATSFQTWIGLERQTYFNDHKEFQLGHVFSDMDWDAVLTVVAILPNVSIGPRLFRHGLCLPRDLTLTECTVSIGPRLFRHGLGNKILLKIKEFIEFQLGHVFSDMDW